MLERDYTVIIQPNPPEEGGGFIALIPELPGCMSDGDTREEAAHNAAEAISEWIGEAKRLGREVPAPRLYVA